MSLMGDPSRHSLILALSEGGKCVSDLAREIGLSQSCTTRHLQALERDRVALRTREGKRVLYSVRRDDPVVLDLLRIALEGKATGSDAPIERAEALPAEPRGLVEPAGPGSGAAPPAEDASPPRAIWSDIEDYLL
jgi:DNA-binding transcriptional ArsR family regulator